MYFEMKRNFIRLFLKYVYQDLKYLALFNKHVFCHFLQNLFVTPKNKSEEQTTLVKIISKVKICLNKVK